MEKTTLNTKMRTVFLKILQECLDAVVNKQTDVNTESSQQKSEILQ